MSLHTLLAESSQADACLPRGPHLRPSLLSSTISAFASNIQQNMSLFYCTSCYPRSKPQAATPAPPSHGGLRRRHTSVLPTQLSTRAVNHMPSWYTQKSPPRPLSSPPKNTRAALENINPACSKSCLGRTRGTSQAKSGDHQTPSRPNVPDFGPAFAPILGRTKLRSTRPKYGRSRTRAGSAKVALSSRPRDVAKLETAAA